MVLDRARFVIKTLTPEKARKFIGYGHAHDSSLESLINLICADKLTIGRYKIRIENRLRLQRDNLRNIYTDIRRTSQNQLTLAETRDMLAMEFLFEFFIAIEKAIDKVYNEEIDNDPSLTDQVKRAIKKSYIERFSQTNLRSRATTTDSVPYEIIKKLKTDDLSEYQSGKKSMLTYDFLGTEGPDMGEEHTLRIDLGEALTKFVPMRKQLISDRGKYIDKFAIKNYDNFKVNLEKGLKDIA